MEIFVGIKTNLRRKGLLRYDHPHAKLINIAQYLVISILMITNLPTAFWLMIIDAKTFSEQAEALFTHVPGIFSVLSYLTLLWQRKQVTKLFLEFHAIIEGRK